MDTIMTNHPQIKTFQKGERIISDGQHADAAYLIEQGSAHVFLDKDGKIVTLATLEAGAIFGEMALYSGGNYAANIDAATDNTQVKIITPGIFQDKLANTDPLVTKILETLIKRLQNTNSALLDSETRDFIEIDLI